MRAGPVCVNVHFIARLCVCVCGWVGVDVLCMCVWICVVRVWGM